MKTSTTLNDGRRVSVNSIFKRVMDVRDSYRQKINKILSKYDESWVGDKSKVEFSKMSDLDYQIYQELDEARRHFSGIEGDLLVLQSLSEEIARSIDHDHFHSQFKAYIKKLDLEDIKLKGGKLFEVEIGFVDHEVDTTTWVDSIDLIIPAVDAESAAVEANDFASEYLQNEDKDHLISEIQRGGADEIDEITLFEVFPDMRGIKVSRCHSDPDDALSAESGKTPSLSQ